MINSNATQNKAVVLMKLERKKKEVEQLHLKLDSYQCVPQTHTLFEKKENLINELNHLASTAEELMQTLKRFDITSKNYITDIAQKFQEFNEIHQEVQEYVAVVRS